MSSMFDTWNGPLASNITNFPGRTPLELAKDPFWVNVFNMTPEYHN